MEFKPRHEAGGWVEPVPGLTANDLWLHLPNKLRARPQSRAFLSAVVDIAADFYSTYGNECSLTAAETRDQIKLLEKAAHELQQALHRFSGGDSDEFESLNTQFDYVVIRNNERPTPQAGRPLVPTLPPATPGLDELLTRINTDLSALLIGCDYAASRMKPNRNITKDRELQFAKDIAHCYKTHFGETPPQRGTFAPFVEEVGRHLSLNIGPAITEAAVESLE